jgi:hypothetical protein
MAFRRKNRDPFEDLATERRSTEADQPWFAGDDDVELEVEAGRSAREEDLADEG